MEELLEELLKYEWTFACPGGKNSDGVAQGDGLGPHTIGFRNGTTTNEGRVLPDVWGKLLLLKVLHVLPKQEQGFLTAIRKEPNDPDIRRIYADWLSEQGRKVEEQSEREAANLLAVQNGIEVGEKAETRVSALFCTRCGIGFSFNSVHANAQPNHHFKFTLATERRDTIPIFNGLPMDALQWEADLCDSCLMRLREWLGDRR